jgi:hypothetical protein
MVRLRRRLLAILVPVTILTVLAAAASAWLDQQSARARLAEAELAPALQRAQAAEARAARAEASLTAIGIRQLADAAATATVVARVLEPQRSLERVLGRLFAVYQDPTGPGYDQLGEVFSQQALPTMRAEADYLRVTGRHLGGISTFDLTPAPMSRLDAEHVEIRTHERWVYDERDASDNRVRCFVEESDQTYTLRQTGQSWTVDDVNLEGSHRSECPA